MKSITNTAAPIFSIIAARGTGLKTMMLALSQGFAILPLSEVDADSDFECFPLGEEFVEMLQLFYSTKYMNDPLRKLIEFINQHGIVTC